mmetsp:Transcript_45825/g.127136  ORF Transcript_45825/g.127136 Transcript_45825/m.127136 type:complete len:227 (-) Transcript_45825:14-694(-)
MSGKASSAVDGQNTTGSGVTWQGPKPGGVSSSRDCPHRNARQRKSRVRFITVMPLLELWSPLIRINSLSPAYASKSRLEWLGRTNLSSSPWMKKVGTWQLEACRRGTTSSTSKPASDCTRIRTKATAPDNSQLGTRRGTRKWSPEPSSHMSWGRLAKAESAQMAPMEGSLWACINAVTAPIERPQTATGPHHGCARKCSITNARSSRSFQPSDTYSPSEWPQPAAS